MLRLIRDLSKYKYNVLCKVKIIEVVFLLGGDHNKRQEKDGLEAQFLFFFFF